MTKQLPKHPCRYKYIPHGTCIPWWHCSSVRQCVVIPQKLLRNSLRTVTQSINSQPGCWNVGVCFVRNYVWVRVFYGSMPDWFHKKHPPFPVSQSWAQQFSYTCVLTSHSKSLLFQHVCSIYLHREELPVISLPRVRLRPQVDIFLPTNFLTILLKQACVYVFVCPHWKGNGPSLNPCIDRGEIEGME